jgi:cellulose synthase/poly-beta-1,6-N-acetylglucosamine synthase-like glycosyltransferase
LPAARRSTPETIRSFIAATRHRAILHYSVNRLSSAVPSLSARPLPYRGACGTVTLLAAFLAMMLVAPVMTLTAAGLLSTVFFINCSAWKLGAALHRTRRLRLEPLADGRLPTYAVLIPLYREAEIVRDLVLHLSQLDYPRSKLQIILILEADDKKTRAAVDLHVKEPHFEVVVVPPGGPRTKPRALCYALSFVRSEYVVVFDAEDRPESDQLRKAAAAFRERPELGCVQARLAPDNDDSWLARMFAVEYAANFEVLLPALAAWGAPVPLGGTSNHFPASVLERVGAWDPFNVTEDADLGIRLARFGYPTATIFSRTHEEAPVTFGQWLPQRRRWIKGWIQTVLLTLRRGIPVRLRLPLRSRLAVHGVLSAGVLGLLLYPASLLVIGVATAAALNGSWPATPLTQMLLLLNLTNFFAILMAALISALRGLAACRLWRRVPLIALLPLYWALMSLAAWQALFQIFRRPSMWEKTKHGVSGARRAPVSTTTVL